MSNNDAPVLRSAPERNYGIDLLKIVAMLFVCILHVCNYGGISSKSLTENFPDNHKLIIFLQALTYCAVDVYAMVSGYLGYNKKFKLSRPVMIWLELVFYTVLGTLLTTIFFKDQLPENAWFKSLMPIMNKEYWYVSAYIGMVVLMPLLNVIIQKARTKTIGFVLGGVLVLYCALPTFLDVSAFGLGSGYSTLWLCVMYIAGGFFAKIKKPHPLITSAIFVASVMLTWLLKLNDVSTVFKYTSPTVVITASALVLTFSQIKIKGKFAQKAVSFVAISTFGIYLIHVHAFFWDNFLKNIAKNYAKSNVFVLCIMILLYAAAIFVGALIIDVVRRGIFWVLHLKPLLQKLDKLLEKLFGDKKETLPESVPADGPAPESDAPAPEIDAPAPESDAPVSENDAPVSESDAPVSESDVPASESDAPADEDKKE